MDTAPPAFTPAQESLFLTLGGRALDSRLPHSFLGDRMADEVLARTGYDISGFPSLATRLLDTRTKVFDIAVRAKTLDDVVRRFVTTHPDAVILDLGAGLDNRIFRVDPPPTVDWYDVDLPEVTALREQVVPRHPGAHAVAADVTDPGWWDALPDDRPGVAVADGLIPFLPQDGFLSLLDRLTSRIPGGELAFNAYTTSAVWAAKHLSGFAPIAGDIVNPGFDDPHAPEHWVPALRLIEEIALTRAPEIAGMPLVTRAIARAAAHSDRLSRLVCTTVLRYRFAR